MDRNGLEETLIAFGKKYPDAEGLDKMVEIVMARYLTQHIEEACREIIKVHPEHKSAHYHLGCLRFSNFFSEEAQECFKKALELNHELVKAHFSRAQYLVHHKDYDEGLRHLE